jgi:hypothetical protein
MAKEFHLRLVLACRNGHESEIFSGEVEPDVPPNAAMLNALPPGGTDVVCPTCETATCMIRPYWNSEPMPEIAIDLFRMSLNKSSSTGRPDSLEGL